MFAKDKYKPNLFNQDSDSGDDAPVTFGTNKDYAKNFNKLRSKELLKKYKNDSNTESSSSDSDESSDNDVVNPKFDEAFYKALSSLKKKDPKIYTDDVKFFEDFDKGKPSGPDNNNAGKKALTVVDYERKILLEKGGKYEDSDDDAQDDSAVMRRPLSPSYNQEQQTIRDEFKKVIDNDEDSDGEDWGGIFKRREMSTVEKADEEENHKKWLAGQQAAIVDKAKAEELKPLKEYWANPKLAKEEAFLRDYILNNGYSNKSKNDIPSYDDIVGDEVVDALSEDEAELEKQAEFEHKYNFRFEEPDADFIKRYPRTIESSVRRTDDRRKEKRKEVKERKDRDKEQKLRELEMLSALRKREIDEKISKLKMVAGNEELAFNDEDLDGDFDPDEYDKKMQAIFNSEYYQVDEGDEKPECPADIDDLQVDDWDNYQPNEDDDGGHCEDDNFNMDCDYDDAAAAEDKKATLQSELINSTRVGGKRKRKRKSKFMEMLEAKKPVFDPDNDKSFGDYINEYYKLDYEDVVGDTPCRFKYTETVPNDFGLTVEEILMAKNKELNQWASLKKATQIRPEHVEKNEVNLFKQKGKNESLKRKILRSLYEEPSEDEEQPAAQPTKDSKPVLKRNNKSDNFILLREGEDEFTKSEEKIKTTNKKSDIINKVDKNVQPLAESVHEQILEIKDENDTKKAKKRSNISSDAAVPKKKKAKDNGTTKDSTEADKLSKNKIKQLKRKIGDSNKPSKIKTKPTCKPKSNGQTKRNNNSSSAMSDERLRAFGINPKKFHKKQKYGTGIKPVSGESNGTGTPKNKQTRNPKVVNRKPTKLASGANREALERMKAKMQIA